MEISKKLNIRNCNESRTTWTSCVLQSYANKYDLNSSHGYYEGYQKFTYSKFHGFDNVYSDTGCELPCQQHVYKSIIIYLVAFLTTPQLDHACA